LAVVSRSSSRLDRDRQLYTVLVALFVALTVVFAAVAVAQRGGRTTAVGRTAVATGAAGGDLAASPAATGGDATSASAGAAAGPAQPGVSGSKKVAGGASAAAADGTVIPAGSDIVVGSVVTQSGAVEFGSVAQVIRAYFAKLNDEGGINGHKFKVVIYDDGLDPKRSYEAFAKLVDQDKALAIVSSFAPIGEPQAIPYLEKQGVPMIPGSGLSLQSFTAKNVFLITSGLANYGAVACKEALRKGQKKAALVYVSSEVSAAIMKGYGDCMKANGGEVVLDEQVQLGQPDYTATALRLRQSGAQVAFLEIVEGAILQLWQAMDRQGFVVATQGVPGSDVELLRTYTGAAGQAYSIETESLPPHVDTPEMRVLKAAVAKYAPGTTLDSLAVQKWAGCMMFAEAVRRAGDHLSRKALYDTTESLKGFTGNGLLNDISYSPTKHTGNDAFWFFDKVGTGWGPVGPPRRA
jgi:ABC-type branched-subunit amino acid transport system substrate-binding protein